MTARRAVRADEQSGRRVEKVGGIWRVGSLEAARQVLRARHQTTQAGFTAEFIPQGRMEHRPILISDGPVHDEQRSQVARFLAPAVVEERYGEMIAACADRLLDAVGVGGEVELHDLALHYTVEVTAEIVGLTHRSAQRGPVARDRAVRAMSRRLVAFFDQPPFDLSRKDLGRSGRQWARAAHKGLWPLLTFYLADVRPAIRERRRNPSNDVIGHLASQGWSSTNILVEAVTYGTAGMVTTREFICMAAWHLMTNPALAQRYVVAGARERLAILAELIRLEPVVGHLYRRTCAEIVITDGGVSHTIPAGDLVDVSVRDANADPLAMQDPLELCPARELPRGVRAAVLSFGDGAHRCPGETLALLEADVLLTRLLARNPQMLREPSIGWDDLVSGYELRGMAVVLDQG